MGDEFCERRLQRGQVHLFVGETLELEVCAQEEAPPVAGAAHTRRPQVTRQAAGHADP